MTNRTAHAPAMALDFNGWMESLPPERRDPLTQRLSMSPDPEREKRRLTNTFFLSERTGIPLREVDSHYEAVRSSYGTREAWGDAWKDDSTFHARIVDLSAKERDEHNMLAGYRGDDEKARKSRSSSLRSVAYQAGSADSSITDDAGMVQAFAKWQASASKSPAYRPERAADYYSDFAKTYAKGAIEVNEARKAAESVYPILAKNDDWSGPGLDEAMPHLANFTGDWKRQFDLTLREVRRIADKTPDEKDGAAVDAAKAFNRGALRFTQSIGGFINSLDADDPVSDADAKKARERHALRSHIANRLSQTADAAVSPIISESWWGEAIKGTAESLPRMGAMMAPGIGHVANLAAYVHDAEVSLLENGVPVEQSRNIAPVIAGAQTALDQVQLSLLKKMPGLDRVLQKYATTAVTRALGRVAATTVSEVAIELAQDQLVPSAMQSVAAALDKDVPGVKWGKVMEETWAQTPGTFLAMLPLALLGAGAAHVRDMKAADEIARSPTAMAMLGIHPDAIQAVMAAPEGGAAKIFQAAYQVRVPVFKGDRASLAAGDAASLVGKSLSGDGTGAPGEPVTAAATLHATPDPGESEISGPSILISEPELNQEAGIKEIRRGDDGWYLVTEDGTRIQTGTAEAALHMRDTLRMSGSEKAANAYISILDTLHEVNPNRETTVTGATVKGTAGGEVVSQSPKANAKEVISQLPTDSAAELDKELALLGAKEGLVQGANIIRDGVAAVTLNQSTQGALTALHEHAEVVWKSGGLSQDDIRSAAAAVVPLFENAKSKEDQTLGFRLFNISMGRASEAEARETMVDLAVANEVGRRKDGSRFTPGAISIAVDDAMRGNVNPAERQALGKFRSLLRAVRAYMRGVFATVAKIHKAKREGADLTALDNLTDKLLGLSEQKRHNEAVAKEAGIEASAPASGAGTFSLASIDALETIATRLDSLRTNPKERLAAFEHAAEDLRGMQRSWQHNDSLANKSTVAGIEQQRGQMRRKREAGLLQEIDTNFGDLSGTEFMAAAMNSPLMDAIFTQKKGAAFPRSMIQSRAKAERRGRDVGGDYDGAGDLPSWVFGGSVEPDVMAQDLYEQGLLSEPTPDALWNGIASALKTAGAAKERLSDYAQQKAEARRTAREESRAWADEKIDALPKEQRENARKEMLRALVALDSILMKLPPEVRAKIGGFTKLASLTTDRARLKFLLNRIDKIDGVMEKFLRKEYTERLAGLLDKADKKANEAGKKPGSTIGADAHSLLRAMQAAMPMNEAEVDAELAKLDSLISGGTLTAEQEALAMRQRELVNLAGDWKNADAAQMAEAFKAAEDTYTEGYLAWSKKVVALREQRERARQDLITDTGKDGTPAERDARAEKDMGWKGKLKDTFLGLSSFDEVTRYTFGNDSAQARALVDRERKAANAKEDAIQDIGDAVADLFTKLAGDPYKGTQLQWKLAQPSIDAGQGGKLSELQAIQAIQMWAQEDGRRHMEAFGYDDAWVDGLKDKLSKEGKAVMQWLREQYGAEHAPLNALYKERHGVNLPQHDNYAPLTVKPIQAKGGEVVDPVTGQAMGGSLLTPGSLRSRSRVAQAEPDFRDALQTYLGHVRQLEHWKHYYELATDLQAIFGNRDVGNSVQAAGGEQALKALRAWKDFFAQGGNRDAAAFLALNQRLQAATGRAAEMILFGRVGTLLIQSTQLGAALAEMPTGSYVKRLGQLFAGKLGWKAAIKSEYIQRRYKQAPPIVRQAMDSLAATEPNKVKHAARKLGTLIAGADALFTAGTYAIALDFHRAAGAKAGMTGADLDTYAHTEAERATDRVAQPTRPGARSLFENTGTSPLARVGWAFASEARQKIALAAWAARTMRTDPKRAFRVASVVWGAGGLAAALIRSAWRDMKDDDDDEVFDERNWSPARIAAATVAGPFQGVPVFGGMIDSIGSIAAGTYSQDGGIFSQAEGGVKAVKKLITGKTIQTVSEKGKVKANEEPIEDTLKAAKAILFTMGLFNDTLAAASSIANVVEDGAKVVDNLNGVDSTKKGGK